MEFLDEINKGTLEQSWWVAMLGKIDGKKFPKKPHHLWRDPSQDQMSPVKMAHMALAWSGLTGPAAADFLRKAAADKTRH